MPLKIASARDPHPRQRLRSRRAVVVIAAACCIVSLPSAHADSSAHSHIDHLSFQLIDLDPTDGITPWMQWQQDPNEDGSFKYARLSEGIVTLDQDVSSAALPFTPSEVNLNNGYYSAMGGVKGTGAPEGSALYAEAHLAAQPNGPAYQRSLETWIQAPYYFTGFSLSPMTELRVTADIALDVESKDQAINFFEKAFAVASITVRLDGGGSLDSQYVDYWKPLPSPWAEQRPYSLSLQDSPVITVRNGGDAVRLGALSAYVVTSAEITPVPEASTTVSLLAGLSTIAVAARFSRQRRCKDEANGGAKSSYR